METYLHLARYTETYTFFCCNENLPNEMQQKLLSTILLIVCVLSLPGTAARKKLCINRTLPIENVQLDFDVTFSTEVLDDGNFSRFTTLSWILQRANTTEFDGYLVRMRDMANPKTSMKPFQDPDVSLGRLWIFTRNFSECSDPAYNRNMTTSGSLAEVNCWCDSSSCSFLERLSCRSSTTPLLRHRLGEFFSIPNTRTNITYETKYQHHYDILIYPYYREFKKRSAFRPTIEASWSCAEDLADNLNIGMLKANQRCCEKNLGTYAPMEVQKSDLTFNTSTKTLNISLSWIPPATEGFTESLVRVYQNGLLLAASDESVNPPSLTLTNVTSQGSFNENRTCSLHNRTDAITIYNLQLNSTYSVHISTWHSTGNGRTACKTLQGCTKILEISTNLCHSDISKCSETADCHFDFDNFTASCTCEEGLVGDGVSAEYNGSGCEPVRTLEPTTPSDGVGRCVGCTTESRGKIAGASTAVIIACAILEGIILLLL